MNLYGDIMNVQINEESAFYKYGNEAMYAYKEGHRDARHVAAELSLKAEARIEELESLLQLMIRVSLPVSNAAYNLAWQHRDQVSVHSNISTLDKARFMASKALKEEKSE